MAGDDRRRRRVARHQPLQAARLDRRVLEQLAYLAVVHRSHRHSCPSPIRIGIGAGAAPGPSSSAERIAQSEQRPTRPRLHRSERPAQALRDLRLGQLLAICEHDRRPLDLGQPGEGIPEHRPQLGRRELTFGPQPDRRPAEDRPGRDEPVERRTVLLVLAARRRQRDEVRPAPRCPQPVDGPVPGDRVKPCRERPDPGVEQLGPVPQGEERLLDHLLGDLPIRGEPARRRVDRVDVTVVDRRQRSLRPADDLADEGGVVGWPALLCHGYARRGSSVSIGTCERSPFEPAREDHVGLGLEDVRRRLDPAQDALEVAGVAGADLDQVVGLARDVVALLDLGDRREGSVRSCAIVPGAWVIQLKARMSKPMARGSTTAA